MGRVPFSSIRTRLILLVLLVFIPSVVLIGINSLEQRRRAVEEATAKARNIMNFAVLHEEQILRETREILETLADVPTIYKGGEECDEFLAKRQKSYPRYLNIGVVRPDGEVYCSALPFKRPLNIADRSYFQEALANRSFSVGQYQVGRITGKPSINFGYPVIDGKGKVAAVVFAALDLSWVTKFEYEIDVQTPPDSTYVKLDHHGAVLDSYPESMLFGNGSPLEKPLFEKISKEKKGAFTATGVDGVERMYLFSTLDSSLYRGGTYILLGIPTTGLFAESYRVLTRNLLILTVVVLLAFVTMWFGGDALIVRPVRSLVEASRRLATGDLSARAGLPPTLGELGQLSQSFDEMAAELGRKTESLFEVRKRLSNILSASPAIIYSCRITAAGNSENNYIPIFVSDKITERFGYETREVLENPLWWKENVHPEDLPRARVQKALFEQGTMSREYRFRNKSGNYRWVLDQLVLVSNAEGTPAEVVGSWTDVTEKKKAEEQIEKALQVESSLRNIDDRILAGESIDETFQVVCDGVLVMGYRMCWIGLAEPDYTVRPVAFRGFEEGYLESIKIRWDDTPEGRGPTGVAIRTGRPCVIQSIRENALYVPWREFAIVHGYLSSASFPMKSGEGEAIGVLHVYGDREGAFDEEEVARLEMFARQCSIAIMSVRRQEELRDAIQRLTFHVNRMPLGHIVWNREFRVVEWNPAAERIFGWKTNEAVGKHAYDLIIPAEAKPHVDKVWSKILDGDESSYSLNANLRKDGKTINCEWFNTPLRDGSGNVVGVLSMVHDVTEKTQLERQLQTAQRMEAVGTLAGGIAHDFNNALTGIFGFCDMLKAQLEGNERGLANLNQILRSADRAATLTRQLLTYSRRQIIEPINVSLNTVITDLLKLVSKVVGEYIEIRTFLAKNLPTIRADVSQIEQVVMNLVLNARDAMPGGGQLLIETGQADLDAEYVRYHPYMKVGSYVVLTVSDTGIGMDAKTQERVFQPFFTTKTPDKGTGLGLAMVYGIVKQNNGFIHLYSEPGKGTTFKIYLPPVEGAPDVLESPKPSEIRGGTETILLAEDDESVRMLVERTLMELGYTVLVARNGGDAVAVFNRNQDKISLALLDVVMPVKGGKEAYEAMHQEKPGLKVIFMSGYTVNSVHESFVLLTGVPFLAKPFGPQALARKVREVLDRK